MSRYGKERDRRDLSASWSEEEKESAKRDSLDSSSGAEDAVYAERAVILHRMRLACCGDDAPDTSAAEELRETFDGDDVAPPRLPPPQPVPQPDTSAEAELNVTFGGDDMELGKRAKHDVSQCPFQKCTYALECARCSQRRKKKKHIEQEDLIVQKKPMTFQMPALKPRAVQNNTNNNTSALERLARAPSQPVPKAIPVDVVLPPLKYYSTKKATATQSAPPPMRKYGEGYSVLQSKAKFEEKKLDDLKAKPVPHNMNLNGLYALRVNQQYSLASQAQSPQMGHALLHGFKALDCHMSGESTHNVIEHLRDVHPKFYEALDLAGLIEELRKARKLDKRRCYIFAVPPGELMTQLRPSDSALRQHVIITSEGIHLGVIRQRTILPTLNPVVDVELDYKDGHLYVNGYKAGKDNCYPGHVALIDVVLGNAPAELPPPIDAFPVAEDEMSSTEEVEMDGSTTTPSSTGTGTAAEEELESTMEVLSTRQHVTLASEKLMMNAALSALAAKMSLQGYQGLKDLASDCVCTPQQAEEGCGTRLSLRVFNTEALWQQHQANALPDLVRVRASLAAQWDCTQALKIRTRQGDVTMNEYQASSQGLTMKALSQGLVELSMAPVQEPQRVTRALLKLTPSHSNIGNNTGTYITANEQLMFRFKGGVLTHISLNEHHTMPLDTKWHERSAILEAHLGEDERLRLALSKSKHDFDAALLQASTLSKYTKKAKKYVQKKARNTAATAKAGVKKGLALKLLPVPKPDIITGLYANPMGADQPGKSLSVLVYDRKMRQRDNESVSGLDATRHTASDNSVFYTVDSDNQLYNALQRTDNYYADVTLDQWKFTVNASLVSGRSQVYYADGAGEDVYVLVFEGAALKQVGKISRHGAQYKSMK